MSNTTCREGRQQPPEPPSATSSSEVLQRRSTHSHKAHSATGLNTRSGRSCTFIENEKKKKVPSSKSISQTLYNRRSIAVTYMGTYRVELYRASQPTGCLAAAVVF